MSTRRCSLAVKMIASCEMDHRSVDFFIHPRRSSFIDSNWLDQSRDLMFLPLIYYNSNFFSVFFASLCRFFARFLRFINYFSVVVARSHRLLLIENNGPFFSPPTTLRPHILLHHSHTDDSEFSSRTWRVGLDGGSWHEFQTIFVCYFASLSYFGSLPIHFTLCSHWRTTARNEQFSELAAIEVIQRGGLCRIGV